MEESQRSVDGCLKKKKNCSFDVVLLQSLALSRNFSPYLYTRFDGNHWAFWGKGLLGIDRFYFTVFKEVNPRRDWACERRGKGRGGATRVFETPSQVFQIHLLKVSSAASIWKNKKAPGIK